MTECGVDNDDDGVGVGSIVDNCDVAGNDDDDIGDAMTVMMFMTECYVDSDDDEGCDDGDISGIVDNGDVGDAGGSDDGDIGNACDIDDDYGRMWCYSNDDNGNDDDDDDETWYIIIY